jgi:NADH oxidase (H2O2-forming)
MTKIVIIGLGAAGFGAVLAAKKQDRKVEITIIDNKDFDLMHQCGLPFALDGTVKDINSLKDDIKAGMMGIKVISNSQVEEVNFGSKKIKCKDKEIEYDKLIIATGSKPFIPPIKTDNKIFTIHDIEGTKEVQKEIKRGGNAIIIGASAIGLETAVGLNNKGMNVTVYDMVAGCFPRALDKDMSEIIEDKLKEKGIRLELGQKVSEIQEKGIVIMATGVTPNITFLEGSIVKMDKFGIEVNEKMETSVKDVYAAGDCCGVKSLVNEERWPSILANNAYREGVIAGANAAGGNRKFNGILGTFVSLIDDIEIAATGFNSFFAEQYKIHTVSGKARGKNRPEWFGSLKELVVKVLTDEKGRIIGGQAIGEGAKERINIISAAIKAGFSLKDISELELAYCPAVSDYYDVLVMAAEVGLRKLNK